jgi:hypothetical protein
MQTLVKQVLITSRNYLRIAARIVPQDQREAIRPGIIISHYAFTTSQGQQGYVIISHTTRRVGISFGAERGSGPGGHPTGVSSLPTASSAAPPPVPASVSRVGSR